MLNQFTLFATNKTSTDTDVHYIFSAMSITLLYPKGRRGPCGTLTFKGEEKRELHKTRGQGGRRKTRRVGFTTFKAASVLGNRKWPSMPSTVRMERPLLFGLKTEKSLEISTREILGEAEYNGLRDEIN